MIRAVVALALAYLGVCVVASCRQEAAPCTPGDTVMATHALECAARVRAECPNVPDNKCPAIAECDAWGEKRCGYPTGEGGAP